MDIAKKLLWGAAGGVIGMYVLSHFAGASANTFGLANVGTSAATQTTGLRISAGTASAS